RSLCGSAEGRSRRGAGQAAQPAFAASARRVRARVAEPGRDPLPAALPVPAGPLDDRAVRPRVPAHARPDEEHPAGGPAARRVLADAVRRRFPPSTRGAASVAEERARVRHARLSRATRSRGGARPRRAGVGRLGAEGRAARRHRPAEGAFRAARREVRPRPPRRHGAPHRRATGRPGADRLRDHQRREGDAGDAVRRGRAARLAAAPPGGDSPQGTRVLAVRRRVLARRDRLLPLHRQGRLPGGEGRMTLCTLAALLLALSPAALSPAGLQDDRQADAKADRKRDELIEDLKVIIPRMPEGDRRADLYFQLAELWWEKARDAALKEVRDHDDAVAKWAEKREGEEPKLDTSRSDGYRREAIGLYQEVLDRYPAYERRDEVLFVAGHNLYESGNRDRGIAYYSALIAQYPKSRFVPDAWVQTGEHFFATNDLPRAREAFEKAASFHLPKLYAFALYKLAWCDYNAGAYGAAIAKFKEVIAYSE